MSVQKSLGISPKISKVSFLQVNVLDLIQYFQQNLFMGRKVAPPIRHQLTSSRVQGNLGKRKVILAKKKSVNNAVEASVHFSLPLCHGYFMLECPREMASQERIKQALICSFAGQKTSGFKLG